jgi:iron complex outermembrane receptor protein
LGWRFQPVEELSLSLATYYNRYDDLRTVEPGPNTFPFTFGNGVKGVTEGAELSAAYQPFSWWRLRGGYTWLRKDLSLHSGSKDGNGARAESDDPHNQALLQSMMDLPGRIELGFVIRYIDVLPVPYVQAYRTLDVRLGWKVIKILELNIVGQNLLAGRHVEFVPSSPLPRIIERGVFAKGICRF